MQLRRWPSSVFLAFAAAACHRGATALSILVNGAPPPAENNALTMRRVAEALADAGHAVTLLEAEVSGSEALPPIKEGKSLSIIKATLTNVTELSTNIVNSEALSEHPQWVQQVMPALQSKKFDLGVVDAVHPFFARLLGLPSVHVQCSSDEEAAQAFWFYYGIIASSTSVNEVSKRLQFAAAIFFSWLKVGINEQERESPEVRVPSWGDYYEKYVVSFMVQGTVRFTLPSRAKQLVATNTHRMKLVGNLMASPKPPEAAGSEKPQALVALRTKKNACPIFLLEALSELQMPAVVLVEACRNHAQMPALHFVPEIPDHTAWLHHDTLRLAVINGDLHSLHEAVGAQLPIACVPYHGDGWANCKDVQLQSLGWALHSGAGKREAVSVFRMLLRGRHTDAAAAKANAAAGGTASVVRHVEELVPHLQEWQPGKLRKHDPELMPFFKYPMQWLEGWLMLLGVIVPLIPVALILTS